jgi:hypothetical protein
MRANVVYSNEKSNNANKNTNGHIPSLTNTPTRSNAEHAEKESEEKKRINCEIFQEKITTSSMMNQPQIYILLLHLPIVTNTI